MNDFDFQTSVLLQKQKEQTYPSSSNCQLIKTISEKSITPSPITNLGSQS